MRSVAGKGAAGARFSSQDCIDRFIDTPWIEDGPAANTLAAYRRDRFCGNQQLGRREHRLAQHPRDGCLDRLRRPAAAPCASGGATCSSRSSAPWATRPTRSSPAPVNEDGWKTVNGHAGRTPPGTYDCVLECLGLPFDLSPDVIPELNLQTLTPFFPTGGCRRCTPTGEQDLHRLHAAVQGTRHGQRDPERDRVEVIADQPAAARLGISKPRFIAGRATKARSTCCTWPKSSKPTSGPAP
jgi:hypothetical protein